MGPGKVKVDYQKLLRGGYEPELNEERVLDYAYNPLRLAGDLLEPVIDKLWVAEHGKPHWPNGKQFAVCLTHDVDSISELDPGQNIRALVRLWKESPPRSMSERMRWSTIYGLNMVKGLTTSSEDICEFDKWLELEDSIGARSTFFFPPEAPREQHSSDCHYRYDQKVNVQGKSQSVGDLVNFLQTNGWEVGLHPSWSSADNFEELVHQKKQLDALLPTKARSVRQHFLRYHPRVTPGLHAKAGFEFDGTIGYNDSVGFRRGTSYPHNCWDPTQGAALDLLEIPLILHDGAMLLPNKGMRLEKQQAIQYIITIAERVRAVGGVLTLSWHPHTISYPQFWETYSEALKLIREMDPWFGTMQEIGSWWRAEAGIDLHTFLDQSTLPLGRPSP